MSKPSGAFIVTPGQPVRQVVDRLISRTVEHCDGNHAAAARLLRLTPKTVFTRLRQMKGAHR